MAQTSDEALADLRERMTAFERRHYVTTVRDGSGNILDTFHSYTDPGEVTVETKIFAF